MSDWLKQVEAIASGKGATPVPDEYDKVLADFAAALSTSPWMRAEIGQGGHPNIRHLVVGPKYRRREDSLMLSFWIDPPRLIVMGRDRVELSDTNSLADYLLRFARDTAFPTSVLEFERRGQEDVHGLLHTADIFSVTADDVSVEVPNAEHLRLARAAAGDALALRIFLSPVTVPGKYDAGRTYFLESAGFGLRVKQHGKTGTPMVSNSVLGEELLVEGVVMGPRGTSPTSAMRAAARAWKRTRTRRSA